MPQPLCDALLAKIDEQIDRTAHLMSLVPADPAASRLDQLLDHLLECLAGFCAVLYAVDPARLAHFAPLRSRRATLPVYRAHIQEGFALLTDAQLARLVPTVFVPAGEPLLTLFLGNLEHLINHKHQLFVSLKEMGVAIGTPDLYCLRGSRP